MPGARSTGRARTAIVHGTAVHERELLSGAERLAAQRAIYATPRGQHPLGQTAFGLAAVASCIARHRVHAQSVDVPIDRALSPRSEALTVVPPSERQLRATGDGGRDCGTQGLLLREGG